MKKSASGTYAELGWAKPEPQRMRRQGFPEAVYCPGKTPEQVVRIFSSLLDGGAGPVIATRADNALAQRLIERFDTARYFETARMVVARPCRKSGRAVTVISAGTADLPVAEEAAVTLETLGRRPVRLFDVGVSGLHRLLDHRGVLEQSAALVVCAGMDGALPSVVGGLASCPVIAVPTSVGYGAHFQGLAPLLTMLNACAANVTVVNIDNGFGAGVVASLISR